MSRAIGYRMPYMWLLVLPGFLSLSCLPASFASPAVDELRLIASDYRETNEAAILGEFIELLSIPNVASDTINIRRNAEHIRAMMERRGIRVQLLEVDDAPPVVFGELGQPGADLTVTFYAHYDGQPVKPQNWKSDPWQPVFRDDLVELDGTLQDPDVAGTVARFDPNWRLFARSAGDDKGPIVALMHTLDAMQAADRPRSINIKFIFDGEEEAGSPHLAKIIEKYAQLLSSDLWLFCDGPVHQTGRKLLAFGVRGATGFDLTVYGALRPLHSGHYGNWAPNPGMMLSHLLSSMRDPQGNVLIDGFYDEITAPTLAEQAALRAAPKVDTRLRKELALGHTEGDGERLEALIMRPALNIRGIQAGQVGEAARNVIVASARASVGIRLVPSQTLQALRAVVERHIRKQGFYVLDEPPTIEQRLRHERIVMLNWRSGYPALRTSMELPIALRLSEILDEWSEGELVRMPTMGGSLPLATINDLLDVPIVILPIANHDNNQHAENENIKLQNLWDAIEMYTAVVGALGLEG